MATNEETNAAGTDTRPPNVGERVTTISLEDSVYTQGRGIQNLRWLILKLKYHSNSSLPRHTSTTSIKQALQRNFGYLEISCKDQVHIVTEPVFKRKGSCNLVIPGARGQEGICLQLQRKKDISQAVFRDAPRRNELDSDADTEMMTNTFPYHHYFLTPEASKCSNRAVSAGHI
ncbi:hypothetical protein Tco_0643759 [Tanacetum coccineum]